MRKKLLGNQFHLIPHYALLIQLIEFNSLCLLAISKLFQKPLQTVNWKHSCSSFYTRVCNLIKQENIKTNDLNTTQVYTSLSISIFTYAEIFKIYHIIPSFDSKSQDQNHLINVELIRSCQVLKTQVLCIQNSNLYCWQTMIKTMYLSCFRIAQSWFFVVKLDETTVEIKKLFHPILIDRSLGSIN